MSSPGLHLEINVGDARKMLENALSDMQKLASKPIVAKLDVDINGMKKAEAALNRLRRKARSEESMRTNVRRGPSGVTGKWSDKNLGIQKKQISDIDSMVEKLSKAEAKLVRKQTSFGELLSKKDLLSDASATGQLSEMEKTVAKIEEIRSRLESNSKNDLPLTDLDLNDFNGIINEIDKVYNAADLAQARIAKSANLKDLDASLSKSQEKISKVKASFDEFHRNQKGTLGEDQLESVHKQIRALDDYTAKVKSSRDLISSGTDLSQIDALGIKNMSKEIDQTVSEIESRMKELGYSLSSVDLEMKNMRAFDKIGNRMTAYFKQYETQIMKNADIYDKWRSIMAKLNSGQYKSAAEANNAFASFRMDARRAGIEVDTLGAKLEKTFGSRIRSALAGQGVFMLQSALQDIVKNAIDFDSAFTEVKKVTDETDTGYAKFVEDAKKQSIDLKSALVDTTSSVASFARLGYDIPMAEELSKSAIVYNNVGDGLENIDEASNSIISTMQGLIYKSPYMATYR